MLGVKKLYSVLKVIKKKSITELQIIKNLQNCMKQKKRALIKAQNYTFHQQQYTLETTGLCLQIAEIKILIIMF